MMKDGHTVGMLSGDLTTEKRIEVLDRFRDGIEKVLISTNVLARGMFLLPGSLHYFLRSHDYRL
jgi:ATP-dependent RNA helicase DDX19/DBP5